MIEFTLDVEKGVATLEPQGKLEQSDFARLADAVDAQIATKGELRGLLIHARGFPGWQDFAGFAAHLRFVKDHQSKIRKIAFVADGDLLALAPKIASVFVSPEIKHFDYDEMDAARTWIESS